MMNISVWTPLSCVPWMAGFTPLEDTEKLWLSFKRVKSLFFKPLDRGFNKPLIKIQLKPHLRDLNASIEGLKNWKLDLLQENQCFSVSSRFWCNYNFEMYSLVFLMYCTLMFIPGSVFNVMDSCHAPMFRLGVSII